jgi:hypothetical protein
MHPKLDLTQTQFQQNDVTSLLGDEVHSPTKLVSPHRIKAMQIYKRAKQYQ